MMELALRGGLADNKANEIRQAKARAECAELVQAWEQDRIWHALQIHDMSTVNRYKEKTAAQSRAPDYESFSRDLICALAHAERLAGRRSTSRVRTNSFPRR